MPTGRVAVGPMVFSEQPQSILDVEGNLAVGATYSGGTAAPVNGAIIEGNVGIGTNLPTGRLHVLNSGAGILNTMIVNQSNAANTAIAANFANANTTNTVYGNGTITAQRGTGSLANTYLYTGIATAITGVAASPVGFGVQGTSETGYGVVGLTTTGIAVHGINISGGNAARFENAAAAITTPVVFVQNVSTQGNAFGVHSVVLPTAPGGFSAALRGQNNGTGGLGIGVWGTQAGSGWGVYGQTPNGIGVYGNTTNGWGVYGQGSSAVSVGVRGFNDLGFAGYFETVNTSNNNATLHVYDAGIVPGSSVFRKAGIYSEITPLINSVSRSASTSAIIGVSATSNTFGFAGGTGVQGVTRSGVGVQGNAIDGIALYGVTWSGTGWGLQTFGKSQMTSGNNGTTLSLIDNSFVGQPHLMITETDNDYARITLRNQHVANTGNSFWDIAGYNNDNRAFEHLNFYNSVNGDLMTITGQGNVGIGQFIPAARLHVVNASNPGIRSETIYPAATLGSANIFSSNNIYHTILSRHNTADPGYDEFAMPGGIMSFDSSDLFISSGIIGLNGSNTANSANGFYGLSGKGYNPNTYMYWATTYAGGQFWGGDFGVAGAVWDASPVVNLTGISNTKVGVIGWVSMPNPAGTNASFYSLASTGGGTNYAAYLNGNVQVVGNFTATGVKAFRIDHPLDPANKFLNHFAIESPELQNVYNGNAKTDANGKVTVTLPSYFEAVNTDYKYQLTIVDETQFAMARVSKKINGNQFEIATSVPNIEVSWQVTAVRNDRAAQKYMMAAETDKKANEKGKYLDPDLYGQSPDKALMYVAPPKVGSDQKANQPYNVAQYEAFKPGKKEGQGTTSIKGTPVSKPEGAGLNAEKPANNEASKVKMEQDPKNTPADTKATEPPAKLEKGTDKTNDK